MKKTIYLLLFIVLSSCSGKTSKTSNSEVSEPCVDCELLGQQLETEQEVMEKYNIKLDFSIIEIIEFDINGKGLKGKIIVEKIEDWNDPGDFHKIRIEKNDTCYTFFNSSGWIKSCSSIFNYVPDFLTYNKINSDYVFLCENNGDLLLFIFGYIYASNPGLLTIVNLSLKEPKLLFNDNYMLSGYEEGNPKIIVTEFFKEFNINKHDTLLLKNHCLHKSTNF